MSFDGNKSLKEEALQKAIKTKNPKLINNLYLEIFCLYYSLKMRASINFAKYNHNREQFESFDHS